MFTFVQILKQNRMTKAVLQAFLDKFEAELPTHDRDVYVQQAYDAEYSPLWSIPALLIEFSPVVWLKEAATGRLYTEGAIVTIWHVNETGYEAKKRWLETPHLDGDETIQQAFQDWTVLSAYSFQGQQLPLIENVQVVGSEWEQLNQNLVVTKTRLSCDYYNYATAANLVAVTNLQIITQFNITKNKDDNDESEAITITH
jgi:hypothetical protein